MHIRVKSDLKLEYLKNEKSSSPCPYSARILKNDYESTQPSETLIKQVPFQVKLAQKSASPGFLIKRPRIQYKQSKSLFVQEDSDVEEVHDIWGDEEEIEQKDPTTLQSFLELYKYRYERTFHEPVSCYNVIRMVKKLLWRHSSLKIRFYGIDKIEWIDFRDWSK